MTGVGDAYELKRMRGLRLIDVKELQIVENPAGVAIDRHRKQILAVRGRRREPDLVVENNG